MLTVVPILVPRSPGAEAGVRCLVLAGGGLSCVPLSGSPLLLPPGGRAAAGDVVPLGVQLVRALAAVHHSRQLRKVKGWFSHNTYNPLQSLTIFVLLS